MENIKIEYFGHACFRLTMGGQRVVLDPYGDGKVPGYPPLRLDAECVFCSHGHADHNAVECVKLSAPVKPALELTEMLTEHDDCGGKKRGANIIRVFSFGGIRVAHFGDLGRKLTESEISELGHLDCAMIPVGGCYTIDAATAAEIAGEIDSDMVIPMHYRTENRGYDVLASLEDAKKSFPFTVMEYGGALTIEK